MSAVAIITRPDGAIVVTDGGGYALDGTLVVTAGKVVMLPEASTVITGRGSHLAHEIATRDTAMAAERLTLDRIVDLTPNHMAKAARAVRDLEGDATPRFSIYMAGWSEARQAGEAWGARSYDHDLAAAGAPFRLPECYLAPEVPQVAGDFFGLRMPASGGRQWRESPRNYALAAICAARVCPGRYPTEINLDGIEDRILVGAFLQVTTVCRHAVMSEIVHEWPDPVGEKIDPERGQLVPAGLLQTETPRDDHRRADAVPDVRPGKRARRRRR